MKPAAVPTVFIVDDDSGMRQAVQDLVESVGLRAESFSTGEEFLKRQRTTYPSCLVLDVDCRRWIHSQSVGSVFFSEPARADRT